MNGETVPSVDTQVIIEEQIVQHDPCDIYAEIDEFVEQTNTDPNRLGLPDGFYDKELGS